jgi:hypothetical protein
LEAKFKVLRSATIESNNRLPKLIKKKAGKSLKKRERRNFLAITIFSNREDDFSLREKNCGANTKPEITKKISTPT